ncbi:MAG TPA: SIR2 family protein, partial [Anaerolineales bacterium]|nr:SIR2 family protein [Anaerolineales bacterium]
MSRLTSRLADLIATDNAILFVGNSLRAGGELPAVEQIASSLAARIEYQRPDRSLSAVARDFEVLKGRNALVTALREEIRKLQATRPGPDPLHQLIADAVLPHTKVLTTRFDQILERALDQFQKPYVLIVRDADVPFFDEAKITLIKMQGDIDQPDSLIITEDDLDDFIRRLPTISDVVRAFFATKTLIFLGYDLNSPLFKRFYNQVTRNLSAFRRQAYAVVPEPLDPVEDKYWAAQNVETLEENPLQFLEDLAAAVKAEIQTPRDPEPTDRLLELQKGSLPDRPYKALDSFTTADAAIFSGRTEESQRLANRILAHRLTLLYGESGSGKSSLMNAGVTPRLLQQRSLVATCTPSPDQPLTEIMRRALLETGQRAGLTPPSESFLVTVREWQRALSGPIVLVLDQFEQFFLVYNSFERTTA